MSLKIYNKRNIDGLYNNTKDFKLDILLALIKRGPKYYIDNINVEIVLCVVNDKWVPIVINHGDDRYCYLVSFINHYAIDAKEKLNSIKNVFLNFLFDKLLYLIRKLLSFFNCDRVIYINNWLFSTTPNIVLTTDELKEITSYFCKKYPHYLIMIRNVNKRLYKTFMNSALDNGYLFFKDELAYIFELYKSKVKFTNHLKKDFALFKKSSYLLKRVDKLSNNELLEIKRRFWQLYIEKYNCNPQYNEHWFKLILENKLTEFFLVKERGTILGFHCKYFHEGFKIAAFLGYDTTMDKKNGIFRLLWIPSIKDSIVSKVPLYVSTGVGGFKQNRGATNVRTYNLLYVKHLNWLRNLLYCFVGKFNEVYCYFLEKDPDF